jgi:hypothetical protein
MADGYTDSFFYPELKIGPGTGGWVLVRLLGLEPGYQAKSVLDTRTATLPTLGRAKPQMLPSGMWPTVEIKIRRWATRSSKRTTW